MSLSMAPRESISPALCAEQMLLYQSLTQLGNVYELDYILNVNPIQDQLEPFLDTALRALRAG